MALLALVWHLGRKKGRTFLFEPKTAGCFFFYIHSHTSPCDLKKKSSWIVVGPPIFFSTLHFCTSCLLTIYFFNFPLLLVISCLPWCVWWSREIVKLAADWTANLNCAHLHYYTQEWAAGTWHFPFAGALCSDCSLTLPQLSVFALPLLSRLYIFLL